VQSHDDSIREIADSDTLLHDQMREDQSADTIAQQAMSAFQHAYLVIDRANHQLVWNSPAAEQVLPDLLQDSMGLSHHYPSLCRAIDAFDSGSEMVHNSHTSLVLGQRRFQCKFAILNDEHVGVMVNADDEHIAQLRKYMADREQLFTTSRTISVSEMATSLAHEINQPVGTIANILKGVNARLKRVDPVPEKCVEAIERALEQTNFASRIVSRIRDFTTARQPKRVDCDVHTLLDESVRLLDWVLVQGKVKVTVAAADGVVRVNADATMLQQVFTNLIRNAVDAMRDSPGDERDLYIKAFCSGDDVQVEIADTGHGLTDAAQDNLFVPFVTQKTQGMGVGLNICRSFVELHQGKLWLMPNDLGGCTASVLLPAVPN